MANTIEEILGKSINSIKELREVIKQYQDELVNVSSDTAEWTDTATKLTAAQQKLSEVMNAGKQSIDAAEDSIVGMERQYKEMYNTYKLLTQEQRDSPFGREMAEQLDTLSTRLNETKKNVGNFKDNIGRYADSAVEAFSMMGVSVGGLTGPLNLANGGFKTLNATMAANPVFWIITALKVLISIFSKVKEAIAGNEESQMRLNQAMSAFQPVIDAVSNGFDKLGQRIVSVIEFVSKAYTKIRELWAGFTDLIGITDGAQKAIQEQNKLYADLAKRTNELTKAKREQTKLNASQEAELKTLLDQAAGTADATEKMNLLNQAKQLQQEITERNIKIAEEEYNLLLEKSKLTANDAETNDKLAAAEAAVARARADGASKTKEMTSQIASLTKSTDKYTEALKKEKEQLDDLLKQIDENSKTELEKLEEKYKKELALLKKYGKDSTELTKQFAKERWRILNEDVQNRINNDRDIELSAAEDEGTRLQLIAENAQKDYNNAQKIFEKTIKIVDQGKLTAEEVKTLWNLAGQSVIPQAETNTEAQFLLHLKAIENAAKAAEKAVADYQKQRVNDAFDEVNTKNDLEQMKARVKVLEDETLTYEEKQKKIQRIDELYQENKVNNALAALEIVNWETEESLAKWTEYYQLLSSIQEENYNEEKERQQKLAELEQLRFDNNTNLIDANIGLLDSIGAVSDAISMNIERTMDDADETEESTKKKKKALKTLQDIQMAVGLAAIAADTAAGIMGIWRGYALEKIANAETAAATGPAAAVTLAALNAKSLASAIINTTGMGIMGAAQMASLISGTISNKKAIDGGGDSGGAAGTMAAPSVIETTPYSYTRQIQTTEEEDMLNRPIYVSVTDIENGLNHASVVQSESSF